MIHAGAVRRPDLGIAGLGGLGETPWVDKTMLDLQPLLRGRVPEDWLPRELQDRPGSVEEFGCGTYGCAMPTRARNLVLKVTTDVSEAVFGALALEVARYAGWPDGMVRYHRVFSTDAEVNGFPVFLLYRDEVCDPGFLTKRASRGSVRPFAQKILDYYLVCETLFQMLPSGKAAVRTTIQAALSPSVAGKAAYWFRSNPPAGAASEFSKSRPEPYVVSVLLQAARELAHDLTRTGMGAAVGDALLYYMDRGILVTDVHDGNIALDCERRQVLISDPGNVVVWAPTQTLSFEHLGRRLPSSTASTLRRR